MQSLKRQLEVLKKHGATEILVRDAHCHGDNVDIEALETGCKLIRGWCGDPKSMVQEIDNTFDGVIFLGYHSPASSSATPLAHTESRAPYSVKLNDELIGEFDLYSNCAIDNNVKVLLVSGDKELCQNAKVKFTDIKTVITKEGKGSSIIHNNPIDVIAEIENKVMDAIINIGKIQNPKLTAPYMLDVTYKEAARAKRHSYFPNVEKVNENTLRFKTNKYYEVLRVFQYIFE